MPTKKSSVDAADSRHLKNIREILEKEHGRTFSDGEVESVSQFIHAMAKMAVDSTMEDVRRLNKLSEFPDGYHFDKKGYSCVICGEPASGEDSWYDSNGLKCMCCQEAINNRIIPVSIIKNKDSYYTITDLEITFNLTLKLSEAGLRKELLKTALFRGKAEKAGISNYFY